MIFSDEFLYYNQRTNDFIIEVYSQGLAGSYCILGVNDDGTEDISYVSLLDGKHHIDEDCVLIDTLRRPIVTGKP